MFKKTLTTLALSTIVCSGLYSEEPAVAHTSAEWQIWAYSTAAPDFIGDFATVRGADGEILREGSNGWVCVAFNPMPEGGFDTKFFSVPFLNFIFQEIVPFSSSLLTLTLCPIGAKSA